MRVDEQSEKQVCKRFSSRICRGNVKACGGVEWRDVLRRNSDERWTGGAGFQWVSVMQRGDDSRLMVAVVRRRCGGRSSATEM